MVSMQNLLSLGPQLSIRAVHYHDEGFLCGTKGAHLSTDNVAIRLLDLATDSFEMFYGTGTSCVQAYTCNILLEIEHVKPTLLQLHQSLTQLENAFGNVCKSLTYICNESDNKRMEKVPDYSDIVLDSTTDDMEGTDWFFDEDVSVYDNDNVRSCVSETETVIVEPFSPVVDDMSSCESDAFDAYFMRDEWLAEGLQHCLPADWIFPANLSSECAIPMQIAASVAIHLWGSRQCGLGMNSYDRQRSLLFGGKELAKIRSSVQAKPSDFSFLKQSLESLHLTVVHGSRGQSFAKANSIVFGIDSTLLSYALEISRMITNDSQGRIGYFNGVIVVCPSVEDFDSDTQFQRSAAILGSSQQARSIAVTHVESIDDVLRRRDAGVDTTWTSRLTESVQNMKRLGVSLLLCTQSMCTDNLVDTCRQHVIAVLPMSTRQLYDVSVALNCTVLESLADVALGDIGAVNRPVRFEYCMDIPTQDTHNSRNVDIRGEEVETGGLGVMHSALACLTFPAVECDEQFSNYSPRSLTEYLEHQQMTRGPVSVVLCASTAMMASALKDRFFRCLHRLRIFMETGFDNRMNGEETNNSSHECSAYSTDTGYGVMSGGGVPEMVCSLHLADLASLFSDESSDSAVMRELLMSYSRALDRHSVIVLTNNGVTYPRALKQSDDCKMRLREQFHSFVEECKHLYDGRSVTLLDYLSTMSNEKKASIAKPINLTFQDVVDGSSVKHSNNNVLDVTAVKIASMKAAISVIRQVYSIGKII